MDLLDNLVLLEDVDVCNNPIVPKDPIGNEVIDLDTY